MTHCGICNADATRALIVTVQVAIDKASPILITGRDPPKIYNIARLTVQLCDDCEPVGFRTVGGEIVTLEAEEATP